MIVPDLFDLAEAPPAAQAPAIIHLPYVPLPADLAQPRKPRRQRRHVRNTRFDDDELAELENRARTAGLSVGAFLRTALLGDAGPRARRRAPVDRELLARNNAALDRGRHKLHQIARERHRGDDLDPFELQATLAELRDVLADNRRALGRDRQG